MRQVSSFCNWTLFCGLVCACGSGTPASEALDSRTSALDLANAELSLGFGTDLPVPVPSEYGHSPSLAFDGENYTAVFEDAGRIRAVRVAPEGTVLDLEWIDFGVDDRVQLYPDIAFGAGKYLVSWSDVHTGELRGQILLPDGSIPNSESFLLSDDEGMYPDAAFDGENFLVAFVKLEASAYDVHVTRVSPDGERIPNSEQPVSGSGKGGAPRLALGSLFLVAWEDTSSSPSTIHAARVGTAGTVLDPGGFRVSESTLAEHSPSVAAIDEDFLVVYQTDTTPQSIHGTVVDARGQRNTSGIDISHASVDAVQPAVIADADSFLVSWFNKEEPASVYGVRVPRTGGPIDTTDLRLASGEVRALSSSTRPALVSGADGFLIAFEGSLGIQGNLLDQDLQSAADDFALSAVANKQTSQLVSWNGQSYVISWVDERRGEDIEDLEGRAVRVSDEGEMLDSEALLLTDPGAFSVTHAAGTGGSWLAGWYSVIDSRAHVSVVAPDGTQGAARAVSERSVSTSPSLSGNGTGYIAASVVNENNVYSVYGTLIDSAGVPGTEFPIVTMLDQPPGSYVFNHGEDYWVGVSSTNDVKLYPVSSEGSVGEPLTLATTRAFLAAASSGSELLVAWIDPSSAVSARRLSGSAFVGDTIPLSASSTGFLPAVSFDGDNFLVAWDEMEPRVLKARTVTPEGVASAERTLLNQECVGPALASNGEGQTLLSCLRYGENAMTRRIVSYFVADVPELVPPVSTGGRSGQGGAAPSAGRAGNPSGGVASGAGGSSGGTPTGGLGNEGGSADAGESNSGGEPAASSGANAGGASSGGRASARGGSSAGTTAAAGTSASVQNSDSDGCSCSVPRSATGSGGFALLTLAAGLAARRIERRRARP